MQDLTVTIIQTDLYWEDTEANLARFETILSRLTAATDLVVLPEMFNTGFTMNTDFCAETMEGKAVRWLQDKALEINCILTGSVLIKEGSKYFNRMIWMRPDGTYEFYNKRHLFRMAGEHKKIAQGNDKKTIYYKDWDINLQLCYDLRFPVWCKNNFTKGAFDYDLMIFIANWPEARKHAFNTLLQARAIENQSYVIGVNRIGTDGAGKTYSGDSAIVGPDGKEIVRIQSNKEDIATISLSMEDLKHLRNSFQVGLDWDRFSIHT